MATLRVRALIILRLKRGSWMLRAREDLLKVSLKDRYNLIVCWRRFSREMFTF